MTALTLDPPAPVSRRLGHPRRWAILALVLTVECMDLLDGTIVNVAAPTIRADLGSGLSALQWIAGGYALTFAVGLVTGGRLGDIYGRRRMFLLGVAGFALASLLCGLAPTSGALVAARLLQGACAAIMIPQGFGIIRSAFGPDEIGKAFALFGPVIGLSAVLGPVLGGVLVQADLLGTGWRSIFLVNLPLAAAALVAGARLLPESRAEHPPTLDLPGAALATLAAGLLVFPLIQGREAGWPAWTFASMAAALAVLAVFVAVERRRERAGVSALVTMSLFRKRAFSAGLACALTFFAGMIGLMLVFSLYLQLGLGYGAAHAGLAFVPWSLGTAVGAGLGAGLLGPRFGRPTLHLGAAVMAVGVLGMLAVVAGTGTGMSVWQIAGPELLAGAGMGMLLAPLFDFVLAGVEDDEVGSASGVLNATQQLSGAIGIAAIGTVFFSVLATAGIRSALESALWIDVGLLAVTAALVCLLPRRAREDAVHA
ncbi:MAG TPA: MFS transporter [Solirubrobacteraceae bacterium]|nr:MFS transporter [Solirubrobacteraceae bacterium]